MKSKKTFINKETKEVHLIKLKKRRFPWWIFLMLIPLLLLIKCNKNITFQVLKQINNKPIENAEVSFFYTERVLLKSTQKDTAKFTNIEGKVTFKTQYSLYSYLFFRKDTCTAKVFVNCFLGDTVNFIYHELKEDNIEILPLNYIRKDIKIIVANKENRQRIPNAKVHVKLKNNDFEKEYIDTTDISGAIFLKKIASCTQVTVLAKAYGYNDTILKKYTNDLFNNTNIIFLRPITKTITFWTKNLFDKNPLPGTSAEIILDGKHTNYKIITNINGAISVVGKGLFNNIHIIKDMQISAKKNNFYDTVAPTPKQTVAYFIKSDKKNRFIYLRPQRQCVNFKIISQKTNDIIKGAECIITTERGKVYKEYSNRNGIVQVCKLTYGDIISITASKNGYFKNDFTIKKENIKNLTTTREIPLLKEPEPPSPCDGSFDNTNPSEKVREKTYSLGKSSGTFNFEYFTDSAPDSIYIYEGNKLIWKFEGATNSDTLTAKIRFNSPIIKVKVLNNSTWWYNVNCPD